MFSSRTKIILSLVFVFELFLFNTGYTDADLFAQKLVKENLFSFTTLSFLTLNTANNNQLPRLIDISGLIPDGFAVTSYRIKKDGKLNFKYHLKANFVNSNSPLCNAITVKLLQDGEFRYKGLLKDIDFNSSLTTDEKQDWILFLGLDDSNPSLKNQVCVFELDFKTWRQNINENSGIFAQEKIPGTISSGNW